MHMRAFSCTRTVSLYPHHSSLCPAAPACSSPGKSTMEQHARTIAYWPGMSKDIFDTREGCADCNRNTPSQVATPPLPSPLPSTPFEATFADFFTYSSHHYLIVGNRLSGWVEVFGSPAVPPLQVLPASFATSIPSLPRLVYRKNSPVTVAQSLPQVAQKPSFTSGASDIVYPLPTSPSLMAEQRWHQKLRSAF